MKNNGGGAVVMTA